MNNEEQHSVVHRPETLARIRQVQEWLISGMPTYHILQDGMRLWNLQKTMMYEYMAEAYREIGENSKPDRATERQVQIQMLMQLYWETMQYRKPGYSFAALHIIKEVNKLKGIYPTRDELKPDKEHVVITLNLGDDLKTGKPENNLGV